MNKIQEPLVRDVVGKIIGEYPGGFLGKDQIEANKNFEDTLKGFASVQFIALYYQLKDDKNKNIEYLEHEVDKLTITETRLQQQIDVAVDNVDDYSEFEKLHNELIKTKTEKLMAELILKKINPTSEIKNAATQTYGELEPPKEHAPQAPRKTGTATSSKASEHGQSATPPPPVPTRPTTSNPPIAPPSKGSTSGPFLSPPVPSRDNKPALTSTSTQSAKPPTRPSHQSQDPAHRPAPPTPKTPISTNKTWADSAKKMEASLNQTKENSTPKSSPQRKSIEEAAADLKREKDDKAKLAAHRRKDSNFPRR